MHHTQFMAEPPRAVTNGAPGKKVSVQAEHYQLSYV